MRKKFTRLGVATLQRRLTPMHTKARDNDMCTANWLAQGCALVAVLSLACASTIAVRHPLSASALAEVNAAIEGRPALVTLTRDLGSGAARPQYDPSCDSPIRNIKAPDCRSPSSKDFTVMEARDVSLAPAGVRWMEKRTSSAEWQPRSVPAEALRQIETRDHGRGALEGFGVGGLVGGGVGAIAGALAAQGFQNMMCDERSDKTGCKQVGYILAGAGLGFLVVGFSSALLIGLPIGAARGHETRIEFAPPAR